MLHHIVQETLDAILQERPDLQSWAADKTRELDSLDKLQAIEWIVTSLDAGNLKIACKTLGIAESDALAMRRVLRVI